MYRKYFKISLTDPNLADIIGCCIGNGAMLIKNKDKTHGMVAMKLEDRTPSCLLGYTELSEAEALVEKENDEWQFDIV